MKPLDDIRRELVRQWQRKAEEDFGVAKQLLEQNSPYHAAIGFHAQQAAEKYLKALLVQHQIAFPKTHDLDELLQLAAPCDSSLSQALQDISVLTPYDVTARYPDDSPSPTDADARQALAITEKVRTAILSLL